MPVQSSSAFLSAIASGQDWREVTKSILDHLGDAAASGQFTLGFLYINDQLTGDAESIINLLQSILGIKHWVGANGIGICGSGQSFIEEPAISVMITSLDPDAFCIFPSSLEGISESAAAIDPWLKNHMPMLGIVHGDPFADEDPQECLVELGRYTGGFLVGGLSSSHGDHIQFANNVQYDGISGILFSEDIPVATTLSQGCSLLGERHVITAGDGYNIRLLDNRPALEVFKEDLATLGDEVVQAYPDNPEKLEGDVCVAFDMGKSDTNQYQVRNIIKALEDDSLMVAHVVEKGQQMHFVHRDDRSVKLDLCKQLMDLRTRVIRERGVFEPKGALYISCIARAFSQDKSPKDHEMNLIREVIGDIPLAGFYANGEISHGQLYGFTGVLTLFL